MKIFYFLRSVFNPPKNDFRMLKKEILQLELEVNKALKIENKIEALVFLCKAYSVFDDHKLYNRNIISNLQDKNYGQLDEVINALFSIINRRYIARSNSSFHGVNATSFRQTVTSNDIFLGGVILRRSSTGVKRKSALFWLENQANMKKYGKKNVKKSIGYFVKNFEAWDVIYDEASWIIDFECSALIKGIDIFKKYF